MKIVTVTWVDSATCHGWIPRAEPVSPLECQSVGYLVKRTKKKVVLAHSKNDGQWCGVIAIPRSAVTSVSRLAGRNG